MLEILIDCSHCGQNNRFYISEDCLANPLCRTCKSELFCINVVRGFIYVLSNPLMLGILKIGFSTRDVQERARELESTGVPVPFDVEAYFPSDDPQRHEMQIHGKLNHYRLPKKEFFRLDLDTALRIISKLLGKDPVYSRSSSQGASTDCYGNFYVFRDKGNVCERCVAKEKCKGESLQG